LGKTFLKTPHCIAGRQISGGMLLDEYGSYTGVLGIKDIKMVIFLCMALVGVGSEHWGKFNLL
jgi:hypothetical protein